jgi:hypothetical protein
MQLEQQAALLLVRMCPAQASLGNSRLVGDLSRLSADLRIPANE